MWSRWSDSIECHLEMVEDIGLSVWELSLNHVKRIFPTFKHDWSKYDETTCRSLKI